MIDTTNFDVVARLRELAEADLRELARDIPVMGLTIDADELRRWADAMDAAADELDRLRTLLSSSRGEQGKTCTAREVLTYLYSESKWEEDVDGDIGGPIVNHNVRIRDSLLDELLDMAEIPRGRYDETPLKRLVRANEEDQNDTSPSAHGSVQTSAAQGWREALVTASMALTAHNDWQLKRTDPEVLDGVEYIPAEAYAESTLYELTDDALSRIRACEDGSVPTSLAGQVPDAAKEEAAAAYFRSAVADGQAAILLADLATYDNVLRELGIQESHKHPVDEVRRVQRLAEAAQSQGVEAAAELIDRKVSDYTSEHGNLDLETGVMEFSRAGEEYVSTLEELAEEIRAINSAAPQPTAGGGAENG